jgi:hypothetical protein
VVVLEVLVVAVLLADDNVVGEVDLDGSLHEVGVLDVLPLIAHLTRPIAQLLGVPALGALPPPNQVLLVRLLVYRRKVAARLALLPPLLQPGYLLLHLAPLLLDFPQSLNPSMPTSNNCEYLFSSFCNFS